MSKPTKLLPINMTTPVVMKSSKLSPINFEAKKKKHKPVVPTVIQKDPDPVRPKPIATPVIIDKTVSRFRNLLPDIEGLTEKILDGDLDHTQAIEVESKADDLVDWAPNVLVWCADKRFLGMKPYAKQAEILLLLFEDYCSRCTDMNYLMDIPTVDPVEQVMAKVALLNFGVCPHCGFTRADGRAMKAFNDPLELIAVIGQRAGKSALTAMAISYLIHRNLYLTSPWKVYSLTPGQVIDFTVVATTVGQSEKTLWSAFKGMFSQSHWFKAYKTACDEEGKRHGVKETIKVGETFLFFDHKGILVYFAANNPSSLRGTTRFGAAIDELGWFGEAEPGSQKVRSNGPETYSALNNACLTLRTAVDNLIKKNPTTNLPIPIMFNISSPRAMNDPIMTIFRDRAGDKRVVRRHWSTWEVNPNLSREALARELATSNGVRDFAAQPPITDDPLVPKTHIVTDCFKSPLATDTRYGPLLVSSAVGYVDDLEVPSGRLTASYITAGLQDQGTIKVPSYSYLKDLEHSDPEAWANLGPLQKVFKDLVSKPASSRAHIMGVDLGTKDNALAVVCGYLSSDNSKFITDFALEIKPSPMRSVNVADVFDKLMIPLVERLNVVAVFYDTWQSVHQIQSLSQKFGSLGPLNSPAERRRWLKELRDKKQRPAFMADQYSLTMADATLLTSRMEQGDCLFPALEVSIMELLVNRSLDPVIYPYAQLALQLSTVRARGARLLKPVGADDDLFRAWANAAIKAFTDETVIDLLSQETRGQPVQQQITKRSGYVAMASSGKGLRRTETYQGGALSQSSSSTAGMPLAVKRGNIGGLRGNQHD